MGCVVGMAVTIRHIAGRLRRVAILEAQQVCCLLLSTRSSSLTALGYASPDVSLAGNKFSWLIKFSVGKSGYSIALPGWFVPSLL